MNADDHGPLYFWISFLLGIAAGIVIAVILRAVYTAKWAPERPEVKKAYEVRVS